MAEADSFFPSVFVVGPDGNLTEIRSPTWPADGFRLHADGLDVVGPDSRLTATGHAAARQLELGATGSSEVGVDEATGQLVLGPNTNGDPGTRLVKVYGDGITLDGDTLGASSAWQVLPLAVGVAWYGAPYAIPAFCMDVTRRVHLRGLLAAPGIGLGSDTVLATLPDIPEDFPVTYHPPAETLQQVNAGGTAGGYAVVRVDVMTNGDVRCRGLVAGAGSGNIAHLSLDGISFAAYA